MKHSMQILETVNYSLFKKLVGNRLIETDRVKDIIEKIINKVNNSKNV